MSGRDYHVQFVTIVRAVCRINRDLVTTYPPGQRVRSARYRGRGWRVFLEREGMASERLSPLLTAPKMVEWLGGFERGLRLGARWWR